MAPGGTKTIISGPSLFVVVVLTQPGCTSQLSQPSCIYLLHSLTCLEAAWRDVVASDAHTLVKARDIIDTW